MNVPEMLYSLIDRLMLPVIQWLLPRDVVGDRLEREREYWEMTEIEYDRAILTNLHGRVSSMISHLSLMIGISLFLLDPTHGTHKHEIVKVIIFLDAIFYVFLVLLAIRALRAVGLDHDYDRETYRRHLRSELAIKYSIWQIVNSSAIVATVILGLAVVLGVVLP